MTKTAALLLILALRLAYQPSKAQMPPIPFANQSSANNIQESVSADPFMSIKAIKINNKIILNWIISKNQDAWCFQIEKSRTGKKFKPTALVFGTDKEGTGMYQFFEKAGKKNLVYRIKLVRKDSKEKYSSLIEVTKYT